MRSGNLSPDDAPLLGFRVVPDPPEVTPLWEQRYRAPTRTLPIWSPHAPDRFAFLSDEEGSYQAYAWKPGSEPRRVTDEPVGVASATIGTLMALVIAYLTTRRAIRGYRALGFLATAPVAIPGIVLGVGLFLSYARPPLVLYGTLWILLLAFVTIALPAAYQQLQSAFRSVHTDLEDASRILGSTRLRTLRDITAPLLRTSVIATWCFIFVGVIRELSAAIMLFTSETKVISVLIFDLNESGDLGAISVLGLIMLAITFAVVIAVNRIPGFGDARLRNA